MRADALRAGDEVRLCDGSRINVERTEEEVLEEPVQVYNFEVADWHTYYVSGMGVLVHNSCGAKGGSDTTRVGRWMSEDEYNKMYNTGQVQMSGDNKVHVANPADIDAFGKQAPKGSVYVEFDVSSNTVFPGGKEGWGIIAGPGSLYDRLNTKKGLPTITEMPKANNIEVKGRK